VVADSNMPVVVDNNTVVRDNNTVVMDIHMAVGVDNDNQEAVDYLDFGLAVVGFVVDNS
jgi:hypothetical protein